MKALKDYTTEDWNRRARGEKIYTKKEEQEMLAKSNKEAYEKYFRKLKSLEFSRDKFFDETDGIWKLKVTSTTNQECRLLGELEIIHADLLWDYIPYEMYVEAVSSPYISAKGEIKISLPCVINGEIRWAKFAI